LVLCFVLIIHNNIFWTDLIPDKFQIKVIIKTQNGSANRTYIQMTILNHTQYNHTAQPPYRSGPTGSIFRCSTLKEVPVSKLFTGIFIWWGDGWGTDSENQNLIPGRIQGL
jgi:hypothetical protein